MRTCTGCAYYNTCGDRKRTEGCDGRKLTSEFKDFVDALARAYDNDDEEMLAILKRRDAGWYRDAMHDIKEAYEV